MFSHFACDWCLLCLGILIYLVEDLLHGEIRFIRTFVKLLLDYIILELLFGRLAVELSWNPIVMDFRVLIAVLLDAAIWKLSARLT